EDFNPAMEGGLDLDTNDDGTLDITPWSRIVDAVGISDGGGSDATYGVPELTAGFDGGSFTVGGASRIPNGTDTDTAADWTRNDFDGDGLPCCVATADPGEAINTPLAVNQVAVAVANDPLINEFVANHDGTDSSEFIEVAGDPSTDYSAFSVIAIEGDSTSPTGTIDRVYSVGTTSADGYWTTGFVNNQLENGTTSFLLVEGFTGSAGDDVDTNDDGAFDTTPWTRIVDDVAVTDGGGSDLTYATVVLTSGFDGGSFTVGGASRIPDATDTDATGDWTRNDFDGDGLPCCVGATAEGGEAINTPDATNRVAIDSDLIINEVDADTPSSDTEEFIELFDGGTGNTSLNGLVVVLYNGNGDVSYNVFDLTGQSTDANGYFVLGNAAVSPDLVIPNDGIQNGADAVALYAGTPGDFPNGTAVTLINLIDALVYGTGDADDAGLLVLLNAGQAQVDEAGGTGSATESNQRCPNGAGGALNTDTYTQATPTVGSVNNCVLPSSEIWEIQGSGDASPVANTIVNTEDNIVTAVGPEGFFMQTPTARSDGDPATSDGIYVFTGAVATGVAVGDQVDVVGEVVEFFDFTEFTNNNQPVTVTVDSSGNPLPPAIVFDAATPSPDPNTPSCPTNNFECFEGMLVTVANGAVSGPNQSFGSDPNAEIYAVADATRAFRETGIEFPGIAGLPVWDGNPEVFEVDPDKLGLPDDRIPAGSTYSATGGLGFEFGGYEIWPSSFSFTPATLPLAVALRDSGEFTIASLNFFRLFDDVDDPGNQDNGQTPPTAEYQGRLDKFSAYIRDLLDSPDVLAVQEVEKLGVLQDLAARIQSDDASVIYTAHLIEGNDVGGIDVGYLTRDTISVTAVTQLGAGEILTFDGSLLHDRPPLLLEADFVGNGAPFSFAVLNNHTRSLSGIDDAGSGPRVRQKRLEQAQSIAQKAQDFQTANPDTPLTVVGDLNAFQFTDGYVDVVGQIAGDFVAADNLLSGPDLVDPNLTIQVNNLAPEEQYSFIFGGSAQVLDHALTSQSMDPWIRGYQYPRGNADAALILLDDYTTPLRSSDHDGLVLFLMSDFDADGVPDDTDNCPFDANADQADNDMDGTGDACDGDSDGDTIPDGTEDQAPNGGDGNGDGVLDSTQPMVTSLPGSDGEFITALTPPGCDVLAMIAVDPTTLPVDPEGFTLPSGMLEFELDCASAVVELLFHGAPPLGGASYRKYGPEPTDPSLHWYDLAGAVFGSTMVGAAEVPTATLTLTDGGQGDSILTPDGRILDPGGPGFISGTPAVEIPTASEVGLIAIALLLAIAAVRRLRHT
ncbi:MAG: choice-of-anchor U domain-containing protein, partial [Acidobacteriota bacterium]